MLQMFQSEVWPQFAPDWLYTVDDFEEVEGGILVWARPSVRLTVRPSVRYAFCWLYN